MSLNLMYCRASNKVKANIELPLERWDKEIYRKGGDPIILRNETILEDIRLLQSNAQDLPQRAFCNYAFVYEHHMRQRIPSLKHMHQVRFTIINTKYVIRDFNLVSQMYYADDASATQLALRYWNTVDELVIPEVLTDGRFIVTKYLGKSK